MLVETVAVRAADRVRDRGDQAADAGASLVFLDDTIEVFRFEWLIAPCAEMRSERPEDLRVPVLRHRGGRRDPATPSLPCFESAVAVGRRARASIQASPDRRDAEERQDHDQDGG